MAGSMTRRRATAALAVGVCLLGVALGGLGFVSARLSGASLAPAVAARGAAPRTLMRAQFDYSELMPGGPLVVYTDALIEAAQAKKESVPVTKDMLKIKQLFGNWQWLDELTFVANAPLTSQVDRAKAMIKMMEPLESTVVPKFIVFLAKKRRLTALKPITVEYMATVYESQKIMPVVLKSAQRLAPEQLEQIKTKLKAKTGAKDIKLITEIDATLIGGFTLEWGFIDPETLATPTDGIDLSLKAQMEKAAISEGVLVDVSA